MEWHPFWQLHSHINRIDPVFDSLGSSWEWGQQKLQQVNHSRIKHGYYVHVILEIILIP